LAKIYFLANVYETLRIFNSLFRDRVVSAQKLEASDGCACVNAYGLLTRLRDHMLHSRGQAVKNVDLDQVLDERLQVVFDSGARRRLFLRFLSLCALF